uniref:Peptidase_M1_N domain-containing protein n=1 Tax=Haemonchus contortus TaxID=6289 RepID=A0A7I4YIH4_HAECO
MAIWSPAPLLLALRVCVTLAVDTGLSPHIQPISYDLSIKMPDPLISDGFTASVIIHLQLTEKSPNITLHAKNLHSLREVSMIAVNASFQPVLISTRLYEETVEFIFLRPLSVGQYLLTVGEYSGKYSNGSTGVIQRNHKLFTTHLQPNFARQLLPCIDHPSVKAPFRMTVIHQTGTQAQSNTIATDVSVVNATWQKTVFAPTPPLPVYLITFSVMPPGYQEVSTISIEKVSYV